MGGRLHGRGALFDADPAGLAPRLIGLRPHQHRTTKAEHPRELPLVVLTGARGLGKSAVLRELRDAYKGHTPVALIDCEHREFAAPPSGRPADAWSPVSQALLVIAEQLAEPVTGAGRIQFPRLMSGLVAVAAGGWRDADSERIRREVERILLLNESGSWIAGFAGRWAGRVAAKVAAAATGGGPLLSSAVEATLEAVSDSVVHRRRQRASTWYRDYPNAGGNARRGLMLLSDHFRAGGTSREHAERYLVRALLADLGEAYAGVLPRMQRIGRPLVLLDNAQSAPGPGLVDAVLRDRAEGLADQVVLIGALRGDRRPALRNAVRRALPEVARRSDWTPDPAAPTSRALLVSLPPLSPDDTLHIIGAVCAETPVPPQLPHATHRLTGGNPLGIALLAESAAQHLPGAASLGELLTAPVQLHEDHDSEPMYLALLDRLVPADRLDELTVLAAAHDHDSACALADELLPDDFGPADVRALQTRLVEEGLPEVPGQFVGDPFVRTLLLLRLHHGDADHGQWRKTHETLIAYYTDDTDAAHGPVQYRLHHELALGAADSAVAYLRDTFHTLDTRAWLRSLRFVASAPYFHGLPHARTTSRGGTPIPEGHDFTGRDDRRAAVALGRTDADEEPPEDADPALHLRIRRLLHAVWQLTDPLALPDTKVCDRLRFELEQLSNLRPAGNALLWRASRDWPDDALAGRPLTVPDDDEDGEA